MRIEYGPYRKIRYCIECKFFAVPLSIVSDCCPDCGNYLRYVVGRYKTKWTERSLLCKILDLTLSDKYEIIGFEPKKILKPGKKRAKKPLVKRNIHKKMLKSL